MLGSVCMSRCCLISVVISVDFSGDDADTSHPPFCLVGQCSWRFAGRPYQGKALGARCQRQRGICLPWLHPTNAVSPLCALFPCMIQTSLAYCDALLSQHLSPFLACTHQGLVWSDLLCEWSCRIMRHSIVASRMDAVPQSHV